MLARLSAADLARKLARSEVSVRDALEAHLSRIESLDAEFGAFLHVGKAEALRMADVAQDRIDRGESGPLTGVPIALKDNISTASAPTTCASRMLSNYVPPFDAHVVDRIREAGMVLLGKTNLDEFAMGSSTETSAFHVSRNPWDATRSPGGSSGGSAVAVAAEMCPLALGSDTGGSIRQPASLCGVVGFKPTYGRVSRYGLVAFASSLDQIGPIARTVEDAALCAQAVSGFDRRDQTSLEAAPIDASGVRHGELAGKRFALPKELFAPDMHAGALACLERAIDRLRTAGAACEEVSLPMIRYGVSTYYVIAPAEASSNLARYDGVRYGNRSEGDGHVQTVARTRAEGFGHEVKMRILIGTYALSAGYYDAYYVRASEVRAAMTREFEDAFRSYDAILSPTCPVPAFRIGELNSDPLSLKLLDRCAIPANLGGFPAISINCGFAEGLPIGLHLVGPRMSDEMLLQTAHSVEQALDATARPPVP